MPSWITHIAIENEIIKRTNIKEKSEFLFANVAPDILEGHIVKNVSKIIPYEEAHFSKMVERNGIIVPLPDTEKFKEIYKSNFKNTFVLGYYTHLLTDYFWNDYCYTNYFYMYDKQKKLIKVNQIDGSEKIETWREAIADKQKDFRIFTKYLKEKIDDNSNFDDNKILKDSNGFSMTKDDILNTIDYLNNIKNLRMSQEKYNIFNEETLQQVFEKSVNFVIEKILEVI